MKFKQPSNDCKIVIEAGKLDTSYFWQIDNSIFNKENLLCLHYLMALRCCLQHLINYSYLLKTVMRTQILMPQPISLSISSDRTATAFNGSGATQVGAFDITRAFDRVLDAGVLHKLMSYAIWG